MELHAWRGFHNGRPRQLDFNTINSWASSTGRELTPFVLNVFASLERTFFIVESGDTSEPMTKDVSDRLKKDFRALMSDKKIK